MKEHTCCKVYLIRHGETEWNAEQRLQGEQDIPLNSKGKEQAANLREKLFHIPFSAAYSSDLSRAHETAEIILNEREIPITTSPSLRETKLGPWEGVTIPDFKAWLSENNLLNKDYPQDKFLNQKLGDNVESVAEVYHRATSFIISRSVEHSGETILMAAHGGVIGSILHHHEFTQGCRWKATNCSWIEMHVYPDGKLEVVNKEGVISTVESTVF